MTIILLIFCLVLLIFMIMKINQANIENKELRNTLNEKLSNSNVDDKITSLHLDVNDKINQNSREVRDTLNIIFSQLNNFEESNEKVVDIARDMKGLQDIMLNPKQRGSFGESQLNNCLSNTFSPKQWQSQYKFKDGEIVDAIIHLNKDKILPIDSKFPMESYLRLTEATNESDRLAAEKDLKRSLKMRIDETSKYVRPNENTLDVALMYLPSESLYYYLLNNSVGEGAANRDLLEYAFRDKHVIIVGPTSLMAFVEVVVNGLKSLAIENEAKEIQKNVVKLQSHLGKFNENFMKMGKNLNTVINTFNTTQKQLELIDKDQFLITGVDKSIETDKLDKIEL